MNIPLFSKIKTNNSLKNKYIYMNESEYKKICFKEKNTNKHFILAHILLSKYYSKLKKVYDEDNNTGIYIYLNTGNLVSIDDRVSFIKTLEYMNNINLLNKREIKKLNYLKSYISYNSLIKKVKNRDLVYSYKEKTKKCSCDIVIDLLNKDSNYFKKMLEKKSHKKEYEEILILFLYFIKKHLNEYNYELPKHVKENISFIYEKAKDLKFKKGISFESKPEYMNCIEINEEFKEHIFSDIPDDFTKLEKAFYIYLKLCNIFTYDVISVNGLKSNINHEDIGRIKEIDKDNNVILCYEFIVIYAKILDELKINYRINGKPIYGRGHTNITMEYNNSTIMVEPTRGVIDCDLTNAKIGILLDGFIPSTDDEKEKNIIDKSIQKVYKYVEENYNKKYLSQKEIINNNKEDIKNKEFLTLDNRFELLIGKLINSKLPPVEIIKQLGIIRKSVFEDLDFFDYYLVANKEEMSYPNNIKLSIVLVFNKFGIHSNKENNYYIYNYPKSIEKISLDRLEKLFIDSKISYVKSHKKEIPGILKESEIQDRQLGIVGRFY